MKHLGIISVFLGVLATGAHAQQTGDLSGRNLILNDGGVAGSTKNTVLISPQDAATQTQSYGILLPSGPAPALNAVLQVTALTGPIATLSWVVAPTLDVPLVFEEATSGNFNIRRRAPFVSGVVGTPGLSSFDAQGTRALAAQTASGTYAGILTGQNNTASGSYAIVLGGQANTASGSSSLILGGDNLTVSSSRTLLWSGTATAYTVNSAASTVFHNSNVALVNSNSTASQLILMEPSAITAYPTAGENYIAFRAGVMANDNIYTLPTAVGAVGQVLKITTVAGTNATTEWQNDNGGPVVQNVNVAGAAVINIAAGTTYLRITSTVAPAAAPVTFVPPAFYPEGTILVVRIIGAAAGNGVTFTDGAGAPNEFVLSGNFQPQNDDTITFVYDATTTSWVEVSRRNN